MKWQIEPKWVYPSRLRKTFFWDVIPRSWTNSFRLRCFFFWDVMDNLFLRSNVFFFTLDVWIKTFFWDVMDNSFQKKFFWDLTEFFGDGIDQFISVILFVRRHGWNLFLRRRRKNVSETSWENGFWDAMDKCISLEIVISFCLVFWNVVDQFISVELVISFQFWFKMLNWKWDFVLASFNFLQPRRRRRQWRRRRRRSNINDRRRRPNKATYLLHPGSMYLAPSNSQICWNLERPFTHRSHIRSPRKFGKTRSRRFPLNNVDVDRKLRPIYVFT